MRKPIVSAIILAAGKGTRMKSPLPKVLHPVAGVPMISKSISAARQAGVGEIRVVVGFGRDLVQKVVEPLGAQTYVQDDQRGTGHAVQCANPQDLEGTVLVLCGDHPLIEAKDIRLLVEEFRLGQFDLAVVTAELHNPGDYGRVVRDSGGRLRAIVEKRDASNDTLKIREINTGIYIAKAEILKDCLPLISAPGRSRNVQNEIYLTDIVSVAVDRGLSVVGIRSQKHVAFGVNDQISLSKATAYLYKRKAERLMNEGVVILDPRSTYIEDSVEIGEATVIYPNVFIRGRSQVGRFCVLEPGVFISDSKIGNSVQIRAGSYVEQTEVAEKVSVGPYARLRPGTFVESEAHIGNFVELKNVKFGKGAKAGHLTYLGDAEVGENTNIGCGTITCNYAADRKKYKTVIGKDVFVGSDTQFVAPITIGDGSVIGSGSTITKDVPKGALSVARGRQMIKENYKPKPDAHRTDESDTSGEI